ncbi:dCTP deaminase [soil metagenome]
MFLSDVDIKKAVEEGSIVIRPFNEKQLQLASYDVTLGNEFDVTDRHVTAVIDPAKKIYPKTRTVKVKDGEAFILHPGESVLGKQREFIGVDHEHLILLSGKSSLARAGLVVHNTAMLFNPGHYFFPTFELVNTNNVPLILRPGMEVAQLMFAQLSSKTSKTYKKVGRYTAKNSAHFVPKRDATKKIAASPKKVNKK